MAKIEKTIDVAVPVREVYNQWTQFEKFPSFMEGVVEVRQLDDKRLFWRADIGGHEKEWDAEIVDQTPDTRIAWRHLDGADNAGAVLFQPIPEGTRVTLTIAYTPEGLVENLGDAMGFVERRVTGDLKRFKELIEARGHASGAWRGEIHGQQVTRG